MLRRLSATQAVVYGTLVVGTLDALERELGLPPTGTMGSVGPFAIAVMVILGLAAWWWLRG